MMVKNEKTIIKNLHSMKTFKVMLDVLLRYQLSFVSLFEKYILVMMLLVVYTLKLYSCTFLLIRKE
jgi:hypothetical protein